MKKSFFIAVVCLLCFFGSMLLPAFADNGFGTQDTGNKQPAGEQGINELTAISNLIAAHLKSDKPLTPREIEDIRNQLVVYINGTIGELTDCGDDHVTDIVKTINILLPDVVQEQGGNLIVSLDDDICTYFIYPAIVMFFFSLSLLLSGLYVQGFMMMSIAVAFLLIYIICP